MWGGTRFSSLSAGATPSLLLFIQAVDPRVRLSEAAIIDSVALGPEALIRTLIDLLEDKMGVFLT